MSNPWSTLVETLSGTERKTPHLEDRIRYIVRLPVAELHILVRPEIKTLDDLRDRKIIFGPPGVSATLTGPDRLPASQTSSRAGLHRFYHRLQNASGR